MAAKATFNATTRVITLTDTPVLENGDLVVDIDVKVDLYSDGKEDWVADETLRKVEFPISAVGGNATVGSNKLGSTFFLASDWKIAPFEASHRLRVNGNFYSVDGTSPFNTTAGTYNVFLEQTVSNLTDSTIQQLPEIEYASFGGGVHIDTGSVYSGTTYPIGSPTAPVNNVPDAILIAISRGFGELHIIGDITLDTGDNVDNYIVIGDNANRTTVTVNTGASTVGTEFLECALTGILDGGAIVRNSIIMTMEYVDGVIFNSMLTASTYKLSGAGTAHFLNCYSGVPGAGTPTIDMNSTGSALAIRNYNGGIEIINKSGAESVSLDMNSGQVKLDSTVTNGTIVIRGIAYLTDDSVGATVDTTGLLQADKIATKSHVTSMSQA